MDMLNSTDGGINGALSKAWKITLTSTNGTLRFFNFDAGDTVTLLVQEDASGSNFTLAFPSTVLFAAGAPPNRNTAAGTVAVYTFKFDGTNYRDVSGGSAGLMSRISARALSTIALIGATTSLVLNLSLGGGQGVGALPNALEVRSNSGAQLNTQINGTGSLAIGSGTLIVGSLANDASAQFTVLNNGDTTIRGSMSGYSLQVSALGAATTIATTGAVPCLKAGGSVGWMARTATGTLLATCN